MQTKWTRRDEFDAMWSSVHTESTPNAAYLTNQIVSGCLQKDKGARHIWKVADMVGEREEYRLLMISYVIHLKLSWSLYAQNRS